MNFLLTDDEPLQLQELTSILRRIRPEAQVFAYAWPDDALEGAKSNPIDVAFLDIQTGGMSGLELALELKRLQPASTSSLSPDFPSMRWTLSPCMPAATC